MIKTIYLDNFKSLVDFQIKLNKFNCLIGLNGAGKTTILQALEFLSQLTIGNLDFWLEKRNWKKSDLKNKQSHKSNISFNVVLDIDGEELNWNGEFNRTDLYCSKESITVNGEILLNVEKRTYTLENNGKFNIQFDYQGSILSQLNLDKFPKILQHLKKDLRTIRSLELLAPHLLRQSARPQFKNIGVGGERLSAFLSQLSHKQKSSIENKLKEFYPNFSQYRIESMRGGWKKLSVTENYPLKHYSFQDIDSNHINDGILRILAILAQLQTNDNFILFDEIENGINPEIIEKLVDTLVNTSQQIMVTTHSPMILNYLEDELASKSVILVYKTPEGFTRSQHFFDIPMLKEKLTIMGPGEAFIDTYLEDLVADLSKQEESV